MEEISLGPAARAAAGGARWTARLRARAPAVVVLGACLLAAGCSGASTATSSAPAAAAPGKAAGRAPVAAMPPAARAQGARLASLPFPGGQAIIYHASMTLRATNVGAAAARASHVAVSAGGYVFSESTGADAGRRRPWVSLVLKVPAAAYPASLAELSRLGKRISQSQHAQDVTQVVADVTSRVASERAAIAQLRRLLGRAGSVGSLLQVQDQINAEESNLESLQSQQRALRRETAYATISMLLVGAPPPPARRPEKLARGFAGGVAVGWRALREVVWWLLTGAGAALPFAVVAVLAAVLGLRGRRWLARRRGGPSPAE